MRSACSTEAQINDSEPDPSAEVEQEELRSWLDEGLSETELTGGDETNETLGSGLIKTLINTYEHSVVEDVY